MVPLLELPQGGEWIVILVIVVLLFGAKRLPELTKNAARAMVEFKKVTNGEDDDKPQVEPKPVDPGTRATESAGGEPRGV